MDPELIKDCVHCGFCLPTCPTYVLWGEEMDSPRGRIHLMGQHVEGTPVTGAMAGHFDACLGCMACVTACPSGVRYDRLIEQTRAVVEREHVRRPDERAIRALVFALFPYRRRLRAMRLPMRLIRRLQSFLEEVHPSLGAMAELAPAVPRPVRLPPLVRARRRRRARVGLLTGCVQGEFFPQVNAATARVLALEGCDVVIPPRQGCCGALSLHSGREDEAKRFARRTIETFERAGVDAVVVNAAGCGSSMKDYAEVLAGEPGWAARAEALRTRDLAEFLIELGPVAERRPLPLTVAYHDACHLAHAQGVRAQPRELLRAIPELELREIEESAICCGSAGTYNLLQPEAARELGDRKAERVLAAGADVLVSANPGCTMQIAAAVRRAGKGEIRVAHTAEVLDASLRGLEPGILGWSPRQG
ncbi:4Fe-4S dicluster domain-containing protein [Microbispora sp. SCL1-1]|jgi:glycolate oxidase iron-sulfur subunit|uniref:Glycolate oxidase iron-sulfur subunit n=1 Tax=Microbispora hainanensis TaxID=568844 RepID=A0ABZ1SR85_9ACTN|nr:MULTISPECIES: heterodisulfide reductase-related iron-sulfur binding cluster [Microbispora]NJP28189.1 4Fe-4S dicluster domain-containing protein [Microbispora sp. CL1-1]TQS09367.1 4Fe-4S dicluster domain-containing protein [Microbispora sp. SCL1-1]